MQLDKELYNEIKSFCELNNLKTRDFIHKILKESFLKEKYSDFPLMKNEKEFVKTVDISEDIKTEKDTHEKEALNAFITNATPQIDNDNEINEIVSDNFFEFFDEKNTLNQNNDIQEEKHNNTQKEELKREVKKKRKLN